MKRMIKAVNLNTKLLDDIAQITDVSYSSLLLNEYIYYMQKAIQKDSKAT